MTISVQFHFQRTHNGDGCCHVAGTSVSLTETLERNRAFESSCLALALDREAKVKSGKLVLHGLGSNDVGMTSEKDFRRENFASK